MPLFVWGGGGFPSERAGVSCDKGSVSSSVPFNSGLRA